MTLVEWTRLEPGQVEAAVAMLVNREQPNSVRITPSRGDGGVDILDRAAGPRGRDVVYQVKSYTEGLVQRQKDNIEDSLTRLGSDERWAGLDVELWVLVTPWNPSPEAENWLHDLGRDAGLATVWRGLDHLEQLAAKYPDVIDYYLRGERDRIAAAQAEVLALVGLERASDGLGIDEVTNRIQSALGVLNHDPHYRFEFGFGEGDMPAPRDRPGLVMHSLRGDQASGKWVTIDVIARCAASVEVDPVTINGTVTVEPDTPLAEEWRSFLTYGSPVTLPAGTFAGEVSAPGGLGGSLEGALLRTGPAAGSTLGEDPQKLVEVLDPGGMPLASADLDRVALSHGMGGGVRAVFEEVHGIFTLESLFDIAGGTTTLRLRTHDIAGLPVEVARKGIQLLSQFHDPNRLRMSTRHTPAETGVDFELAGLDWGEERSRDLAAVSRILDALSTIQSATPTVVRTPDFTTVPREQFRQWRTAAALLSGQEVTATYPEGAVITLELATEVTPGEGEFGVSLPHTVMVDDQLIDLGRYEVWLDSPTLVGREPAPDGGAAHHLTTADRTVRWRREDRATSDDPESAVREAPDE